MMVLDRAAGTIEDRRFADFPSFVGADDLLVLNDTRVVAARFLSDDGRCEILRTAILDAGTWKCLVRPGKRLRPGRALVVGGRTGTGLTDGESPGHRVHLSGTRTAGADDVRLPPHREPP